MKLSNTNLEALTREFAAIAACPACRGSLALKVDCLICDGCGRSYPQIDGIWRFLLPEQAAQYQPLIAEKQHVDWFIDRISGILAEV